MPDRVNAEKIPAHAAVGEYMHTGTNQGGTFTALYHIAVAT